MNMFRALEISLTGLTAERLRMDLIANNLANVNTTRTRQGGPFRRKLAVFASRSQGAFGYFLKRAGLGDSLVGGVQVVGIVDDPTPPKLRYDPGHPDADQRGYVALPNVDVVSEMVDLISASRSYEANVTAANAAKYMAMTALEIGRG